MKKYWQQLSKQLERRSQRELKIILAGAIVVVFFMWYVFLMPSVRHKNQIISGKVSEIKTKTIALQTRLAAFKEAISHPPDAALVSQQQQLQTKAKELADNLAKFHAGLVTATSLPAAIKTLIAQGKNLSLNDLAIVPAEVTADKAASSTAPVPPEPAPTASTPTPPSAASTPAAVPAAPVSPLENTGINEQFFQITYHGNYFATLQYLQALQNAQWIVAIDDFDYQVTYYPLAAVTIKMHLLNKGN
jgi:cytoskeletal protein RodZ